MQTIRWGIIGCGDVTEIKSGPGFQKAVHSQLVAVMRRNAELAKDYATRHNVPNWYDDASALINDPEVDAVYIATPPLNHKEYVLKAARAGKPVYVEKPMAMNYAEAVEMVDFCEQAKIPLFVAHYRRALPRFIKIKELLSNQRIGQVRFVNMVYQAPAKPSDLKGEMHWRLDLAIAGCGYFCDLAPHMIDIIQFLLGIITEAGGYAINQGKAYPAEDMVAGSYLFENGIPGTGLWNFNSYKHTDRTEIVGDGGKLTFAVFGDEPIILETEQGIEVFPVANPAHMQQPLIQTIVNQLVGNGHCPSMGRDALRTSWVMDKLLGRQV